MAREFDHTVFAGDDAARRVRAVSSAHHARTFIWQLWPGRNWPCTAVEEAQFVEDLKAKVDSSSTVAVKRRSGAAFDRNDVTALMNSLRCGLTCDDLLTRAPGLKPDRLLHAYVEIDRLRAQSVAAWDAIVEERTLEALVDWSAAASVLLSTPVRALLPAAATMDDEAMFERVQRIADRVAVVSARALTLEESLNAAVSPDPQAIAVGRMLYDPYDPSVWGDPYFLPPRVGVLMPLRLADLLGERRV